MLSRELDLGGRIARRAGEIALGYWQKDIQAEAKPDLSPVTIADRTAEKVIAQALEEAFPEDGILGEEGASRPSRSGRQWIIDPIDGTRDFVRGNPAWAVLIALEAEGEVLAGFSLLPAMGDFFFAARGRGAFCNDNPIRISKVESPASAVMCLNGFNTVQQHPFAGGLLDFMSRFWAVRSMGGCLDAMMVARGQADLWMDGGGKVWDYAPLKVIAEEAGARFFNFDGNSSPYGGSCVICVPALESEARRFVMQY
ncbi:MAG: inositol monophosphatase family protein [Bryobacteraceae bacterium]